MSELLTSFWEVAFLRSFSQSWKLESTTKRNFAGNFSLVRSLALNVDLLFSIILNRALRDWDPTLSITEPEKVGINSLSAKSILAGEKLVATYSIST
jgi:hypothetical protein